MNRPSIRRGVGADAPALAEFAARSFSEAFATMNRPQDTLAYVASAFGIAQQSAELADPDIATLMAYLEGSLVAYAQLKRGTPPACVSARPAIELHRFYVDRRVHGTGVAQALMSGVRACACDFGARHLWLSSWDRNTRAMRFYARCGFVDVGGAVFVVGEDRQSDRILVATVGAAES